MFPTTPILDDFNRADENPLVGYTAYANTFQIINQQATAQAGQSSYNRKDSPILSVNNQESYLTLSTLDTAFFSNVGIHVRASATSYYLAQLYNTASGWRLLFQKFDSGFTDLTLLIPVASVSAGDNFGMRIVDTRLAAFLNGVEIGSVSDGAITTGSQIGFSVSSTVWRVDDFGGGTYYPEAWASCSVGCM